MYILYKNNTANIPLSKYFDIMQKLSRYRSGNEVSKF